MFALALACFAQEGKPPADVDQALRARVDEFFKYHVTAQFRKAEALVAEDSKDFFYNTDKPHYISYGGIKSVRYSENFTHAYVVVTVRSAGMEANGFPDMPLPMPSMWKIDDGKWCWYIDEATLRRTPFGEIPPATYAAAMAAMKADPGITAPKPTPIPPEMAAALKSSVPDGSAMHDSTIPLGQIQVDQTAVGLKPGQNASVPLKNTSGDRYTLLVMGQVEGVQTTLDRKELGAHETATLTLRAGGKAKSGKITVVAVQTGEMFPIEVTVK